MALHVVLGFPEAAKSSIPEAIYLGHDADAAAAARDAFQGARTLWLRNPKGISKIAAHIAAAADAERTQAEIARALAAPGADPTVEQRLADAVSENERLRRDLEDAKRATVVDAPVSVIEPATEEHPQTAELNLESETLPMVNSSEPSAEASAPADGDEGAATAEPEDPEAAARRQAAEAAAAAAEQIEAAPPKKKGK